MQRVGEILQRVLAKRGLKAEADASLLLAKANRWLAEKLGNIAGDAKAVKFKNGELTLEARTSIAVQEAHSLQRELRAHLHRELPTANIEQVRIVRSR
jgi:hypothetical protein